jgi:HNH endonuclease
VLREVANGEFVVSGLLFRRYRFQAGRFAPDWRPLRPGRFRALALAQETEAVELGEAEGRRYWWCRERFYWDSDDLSADDVLALAFERERSKRRRLDRAHAVLATERGGAPAPPGARRERIPSEVRRAVFERDGGRCVECGSDFDLQYDHVIPLALGGANSERNLQLLCSQCNQRKGASLG